MPLISMTGQASSQATLEGEGGAWQVRVELRGVNARFLELRVRQPFGAVFEAQLRQQVSARIGRGRIDLELSIARAHPGEAVASGGVAEEELSRLWATLKQIRNQALAFGLEVPLPNALECLKFIGVDRSHEGPRHPPEGWATIVDQALRDFQTMRQHEGAALAGAIGEHLAVLRTSVETLQAMVADEAPRRLARLHERVTELLDERARSRLDVDRLEQEVALMVARTDVCEELERIHAHLEQCFAVLTDKAQVGQGKRLDFLAQELLREFTTLGTKMPALVASGPVVAAKMAIERVREQAQNVE